METRIRANTDVTAYARHARPTPTLFLLITKSDPKTAHCRLESRLAIVRIVYRTYKSVWSNLNVSGRFLSVFRTLARLHTTFVGFSHEQVADEVD